MIYDFAIVGSGISASIASAYLRAEKKTHCLIEKYERIGGRFSTVEIAGKFYNHGNLFIRDSHQELVELVNYFCPNLLEKIAIDYVNLIDNQFHFDSRFIYLPSDRKMETICSRLISDSKVITNFDVIDIEKNDTFFTLSSAKEELSAKHIILSTPPITSQNLLADLGISIEIPESNSIFTLLAEYDEEEFDFTYYKFINHTVLKEIFVDKKQKNLVIHANDYIHDKTSALRADLIQANIYKHFKAYFKFDLNVLAFKLWKYGKDRLRKNFDSHFRIDQNHIFIFTDWVANKRNSNAVGKSFQNFNQHFKTYVEEL